MSITFDPIIRMIPIKQIEVLNSRERGKKKFAQIAENIIRLGLKRPVTVALLRGNNSDANYGLVCGQGRLNAYIQKGETVIPSIVVKGSREELLLMSLAENLARRKHSNVELVREISGLKSRGYNSAEIAKKVDLDVSYVRGILQLLEKGEERLISAVEKGHLPIYIALIITTSDDKSIQKALQDAYERNDLRGRSLIQARKLIESRRVKGKKQKTRIPTVSDNPVSANSLLKTFQEETLRQKIIVQKAKISETRLLFAVNAMKQLFKDDHFVTLLRAESLDTLPEFLAEQVYKESRV